MTTLTAAQIARFRAQAGDTNTTPVVSDTVLQALYDDAESDEALTMVYYIRWRIGLAVDEVQFSAGDQQKSGNQHFEQLERLLAYWESKAATLPTMTSSTISLGIDEETPTITNP